MTKTPEFSITLFPDGRIKAAPETLPAILKWRPEELFGHSVTMLVPAEAQELISDLFTPEIDLDGAGFPALPLRFKPGGYIRFDARAVRTAAGGGYRLDFFRAGSMEVEAEIQDLGTFFSYVEKMVAGSAAKELNLQLIDIPGLKDPQISPEARDRLKKRIESKLAARALGGRLGEMADGAYGFLSSSEMDAGALQKDLVQAAEQLGLPAEAVEARTDILKIDDRTVDGETLKKALNHARGVFVGEIDQKEGLGNLSAVISGIEHHRNLILRALRGYKFRASPRPLRDGKASSAQIATLLEGKVNIDGYWRRPDELIVLRDHRDIALEHDLAQIDEIARMRKVAPESGQHKDPYYDLNSACLEAPDFAKTLEETLAKKGFTLYGWAFRVKGLPPARKGGPAWQGLHNLVNRGARIWIDRFADVVTDKDKMSWIKDGLVELTPGLLDRIALHPDGRALISKLVGQWRDAGVKTLYADLRTHEQEVLAHEIGVALYLEKVERADNAE